jgi:hypothetical protein
MIRKLLWLVLMVPGLCWAQNGGWCTTPLPPTGVSVCGEGATDQESINLVCEQSFPMFVGHQYAGNCAGFWNNLFGGYVAPIYREAVVSPPGTASGLCRAACTSSSAEFTSYTAGGGYTGTGGSNPYPAKANITSGPTSSTWIPMVSFGTTMLPPSDYTVTYASYQQSGQEMHAEVYLTLTSKGSANATDAFSIGGLPCTSATNAGGGTMLAGYNFGSTITQTPTVEVSGTQAYFLHWTGTGLSTIKYSDVQNNTVVATSFTYLCQ